MTKLTRIKLLVAGLGVVVWGIGVRTGDEWFKWGGVVLLVGAFFLRFLNPRDRV